MDARAMRTAAEYLGRARLHGERLEELADSVRPQDESEAYGLQDALHQHLTAGGAGRIAGYKIGCTTDVMQQFLKIPNPCAGGVFDTTVVSDTGAVDYGSYLHVGVECELAVRVSSDLSDPNASHAALLDAIDCVMPAIEIVDDRWQDYSAISTPTLIADDFFGAGCVLGPPNRAVSSLDLASITGGMTINGEKVGDGTGSDILGHPLNALGWLVKQQSERGQHLRAGDFVLLGSLVQTVWVQRGDRVLVDIDGLGQAGLAFN